MLIVKGKRRPPTLILIEPEKNRYTRYIGSLLDVRTVSKSPLSPEEVELFRTRPALVVEGYDDPEVA